MNVYEFLYEFDKLIETVDPKFKEEPVDTDTKLIVLNIAQTRYLYNKYLNKPTFKENILSIQNSSDDLKNLIVREILQPTLIATGPLSGGIGYTINLGSLSNTYLYYLKSNSNVIRTQPVSIAGWVDNLVAESYAEVNKIITNIYNSPLLNQPVVFFEQGNTMIIVVDKYTSIGDDVPSVEITYLRTPKYLALSATATTTLTCELSRYNHEEMIRLAVDIYLKEYKYMLQTKQN
jgi:hypothetical protein